MKKLVFISAILLSTAAYANSDTVTGSGTINDVNGAGNIVNSNNGTSVSGGVSGGAGGSATSDNTNVNTAVGGSADNYNKVEVKPVTVNTQVGGDNKAEAKTGPVSVNSPVTIKTPRQAPAVFNSGLVNGFDCNGSTTLGGSVAGFGIGGGSTHANEDCINVYLARELDRRNDGEAAWAVLCESEKVARHSTHCKKEESHSYTPVSGNSAAVNSYPTGGRPRSWQ